MPLFSFISSTGCNVHGAVEPRAEREVGRITWVEECIPNRVGWVEDSISISTIRAEECVSSRHLKLEDLIGRSGDLDSQTKLNSM